MIRWLCVLMLATPLFAGDRPNVVLFIADDVSWNDYGCYGNAAARTPAIDRLAENGIRFDHAYLTASSCSPSRSSIITGRYPHNNGAASQLHQPISGHLPWFPEILRAAGYYTALSGKHHMSTTAPKKGPGARPKAFDHIDRGRTKGNSGGHANWVEVLRQRPVHRPFFFWFASIDAHRKWDADRQWEPEYGPMHRAEEVVVPPFLVDDDATRQDLASYYNEVTRFDFFVGQVVQELKHQAILDETLILVMADNGRPFPRAKTRLHDSGMRTGLIAHWPSGIQRTGPSADLISAIDLAPTILDLTECDIPRTMQGLSFAAVLKNRDPGPRSVAFSEHNWHDYEAHGRSIRRGDHLLLQNYRPELAWQGPADSVRSPSHQSLLAASDSGKLREAQKDVLLAPRPDVELYLVPNDPFQLKNLAGDPAYATVQQELSQLLGQWMEETGDSVPAHLKGDTFDRRTGERVPRPDFITSDVIAPGQDRSADRINASGPR